MTPKGKLTTNELALLVQTANRLTPILMAAVDRIRQHGMVTPASEEAVLSTMQASSAYSELTHTMMYQRWVISLQKEKAS